MKRDDVKGKSAEELMHLAHELQGEIMKLRLQHRIGQLKEATNIKKSRHQLARIWTELRMRERSEVQKEKQ